MFYVYIEQKEDIEKKDDGLDESLAMAK